MRESQRESERARKRCTESERVRESEVSVRESQKGSERVRENERESDRE